MVRAMMAGATSVTRSPDFGSVASITSSPLTCRYPARPDRNGRGNKPTSASFCQGKSSLCPRCAPGEARDDKSSAERGTNALGAGCAKPEGARRARLQQKVRVLLLPLLQRGPLGERNHDVHSLLRVPGLLKDLRDGGGWGCHGSGVRGARGAREETD